MVNHKMSRKGDTFHIWSTIVGLVIIVGAFVLKVVVKLDDATMYKVIVVGAIVTSPSIVVDKVKQMLSRGK